MVRHILPWFVENRTFLFFVLRLQSSNNTPSTIPYDQEQSVQNSRDKPYSQSIPATDITSRNPRVRLSLTFVYDTPSTQSIASSEDPRPGQTRPIHPDLRPLIYSLRIILTTRIKSPPFPSFSYPPTISPEDPCVAYVCKAIAISPVEWRTLVHARWVRVLQGIPERVDQSRLTGGMVEWDPCWFSKGVFLV